jgi:Matrixin
VKIYQGMYRKLLTAGLLTIGLPVVLAYNVDGKRWLDGAATFYTGMPGRTPGSTTSWSSAFEAAMQEWTDNTDFTFIINKDYASPCAGYSRSNRDFPNGTGDQKNGADFSSSLCGNAFGSGVLAVTLTQASDGKLGFGHLEEADIVFNAGARWDVYSGPRTITVDPRTNIVDFGRVAVHELGHALGLDHESVAPAIMAPRITDLSRLQPDDIAGANAIYGKQALCRIIELPLNAHISNSLEQQDCRVKELYGAGSDDSFVDVYRFSLSATTRLFIDMRSSQMDPVIVLTDGRFKELDIFDDTPGSCNARLDRTLPAGDYYVLANTYAQPKKCVSNVGPYTLSITDSLQPVLGDAATTTGATPAASLFTGGASADGGLTYATRFAASTAVDVHARIVVDPRHVGRTGKLYVLVQLSDGGKFNKNSAGVLIPVSGDLAQLISYKSGALAAIEEIPVVKGFRAEATPFAGLGYAVYVGYSLDSRPGEIHYGNAPIRFSIAP